MATTFDIGDKPTVTATVRDSAGVLADPTTVAVQYINPAGTQTTGTNATSASTGIWTWTFPSALDQSGRWRVKFTATGAVVAAEEVVVTVRSTEFT